MSLQNPHDEMILEDPIELVSRLVIAQDWFLKQTSAHALLADVPGRWGHYQLLADWHADTEVLNVEARLDVLVDRKDELAVQRLLAELNTELYLGHFQLSPDRQHIILRCRLPLRGAGGQPRSKSRILWMYYWGSVSKPPRFFVSLSMAGCQRISRLPRW